MIDLKRVIIESLTDIPSDEELRQAALSQRDIPENVMLEVTKKLYDIGCSAILIDLLEHVGDLSHRLQEPGHIGMSGAGEKIRKLNSLLFPIKGNMNLEQEIEYGIYNNVLYHIISKNPKYNTSPRYLGYEKAKDEMRDEIAKSIDNINTQTRVLCMEYANAHREHNKPITIAGKLGRDAAICLGDLNFIELRKIANKLTSVFNKYSNSDMIYKI